MVKMIVITRQIPTATVAAATETTILESSLFVAGDGGVVGSGPTNETQ